MLVESPIWGIKKAAPEDLLYMIQALWRNIFLNPEPGFSKVLIYTRNLQISEL